MNVKAPLFATLCLAAVMCAVGPGASVEAQQTVDPSPGASAERTNGDVVGASVSHPESWAVEREDVTYDGTYGYTLWRPESNAPHDHGGTPAMRVALDDDLRPGQIEAKVKETIAAYPDLPIKRETVSVAENGYEGAAVGTIPGSTPYTEVYVPVNGRVYRINVFAARPGEEGLDAADKELLSSLRFSPPAEPVELTRVAARQRARGPIREQTGPRGARVGGA